MPGLMISPSAISPCNATGGEWNPLFLGSKLLAWWDADDLSTLTLGGGNAVASWVDKKNSINAAQSTEEMKPIWTNGTRAYLDVTNNQGLSFPTISNVNYVAAVVQCYSSPQATATLLAFGYLIDSNNLRLNNATSFREPATAVNADDCTNDDGNIFINGVDTPTFSQNVDFLLECVSGSLSEKQFGAMLLPSIDTRYWKGRLSQLVFCSSTPSDSERTLLRSYMGV